MARSREKAQLMMNRWASLRDGESGPARGAARRPYLASEVKSLSEAEKWRLDLLREVGRKVADIQNAGLGEARIRDLNDEINKLLREKVHWERQIKALGGPNYAAAARAAGGGIGGDAEGGREVAGSGGYKYFGAARDLPGVRELFATEGAGAKRPRNRGEILRALAPDYYGYRDEEDGELVRDEAAAQARIDAGAAAAGAGDDASDDDVAAGGGFAAHVPLPPQAAIDAAVLERKRQLLLAKYVGAPASKATT